MTNAASTFLHIFHESFYSFCSLHSVFRPSLHSCVCMEWYGTQKHMVQGKRYVYCFSFHEFFHLTALDLEAFTKNLGLIHRAVVKFEEQYNKKQRTIPLKVKAVLYHCNQNISNETTFTLKVSHFQSKSIPAQLIASKC